MSDIEAWNERDEAAGACDGDGEENLGVQASVAAGLGCGLGGMSPRDEGFATARRARRKARPDTEALEARRLFAANFTGDVVADFPIGRPGVVVVTPSAGFPFAKAESPPNLADLIKVSGLELSAIRLFYDASDDTLSVGLEQPENQKTGQRVIIGDIDNNLNGGTVDQAVLDLVDDPSQFKDFPLLQGSESAGAQFDFNGDGVFDVVAGIADAPATGAKSLLVARIGDVAAGGSLFGESLSQFAGASFIGDTPADGAFEFTINRFSELYRTVTSQALGESLNFNVLAFAGSANDSATEARLGGQVRITIPRPEPELVVRALVNPHDRGHVNTFANTLVRVNIFGSRSFDVSRIDVSSVRLAGAAARRFLIHKIDGDRFDDLLLVLRGRDLDLPRGSQMAVITGRLSDGTSFRAPVRIDNQPRYRPNGGATNPPPGTHPVPGEGVRHASDSVAASSAQEAPSRQSVRFASRPQVARQALAMHGDSAARPRLSRAAVRISADSI